MARAWGTTPAQLRDHTLGELRAMGRVLAAEDRARTDRKD